jgi:hypothetical protein
VWYSLPISFVTLESRSSCLLGRFSRQLCKTCAGPNMAYSRTERVFIPEHYFASKSFAAVREAFSKMVICSSWEYQMRRNIWIRVVIYRKTNSVFLSDRFAGLKLIKHHWLFAVATTLNKRNQHLIPKLFLYLKLGMSTRISSAINWMVKSHRSYTIAEASFVTRVCTTDRWGWNNVGVALYWTSYDIKCVLQWNYRDRGHWL